MKIGSLDLTVKKAKLDYYGEYDRWETAATVGAHLGHQQQIATLVHEILHAICHERGVFKTHQTKAEEEIVAKLEGGITAFIKDNPAVIKFIQGK